jgi:hypothetical protein
MKLRIINFLYQLKKKTKTNKLRELSAGLFVVSFTLFFNSFAGDNNDTHAAVEWSGVEWSGVVSREPDCI